MKFVLTHNGMQLQQNYFQVCSYNCLDFPKLEYSRSYVIHEARHSLNLVILKGSLKPTQR